MIEMVTGASGFIGSRLVKMLGDDVWELDHCDIQYGKSFPAERFFFLSTYGNMAHHNHHDLMVHANVENLLTVLNGFHGWFCYMSSSSVTLPVQTPYSRTKRAAEEILQALPELKSCIVRPYSVTGVGEQKEHLIPTLIRSCMEGEEMPFDPFPVHDFVDVSDIVDGLIYCADNQITGIVEMGNGLGIANQVILEMVEHFTQKKANIKQQMPLRSYDNKNWYCRNKPAWWKPKKTIANSIEEMVQAYKNEHCPPGYIYEHGKLTPTRNCE